MSHHFTYTQYCTTFVIHICVNLRLCNGTNTALSKTCRDAGTVLQAEIDAGTAAVRAFFVPTWLMCSVLFML